MINGRKKGHSFERICAQEMRDLGYSQCVTSRASDRSLDDSKVDLNYTGSFNIQCKCFAKRIPYDQILKEMPKDKHNIILNKLTNKGEFAIMSKETFYWLITQHLEYQDIWSKQAIEE